MSNYPKPINDSRLTPDLCRTRAGRIQQFSTPETARKTFEPDFKIEPPEPHIYAELINNQWNWVNGCDECNGKEGTWLTYIKCKEHDVCHSCKAARHTLKSAPWGHPKGIMCSPCMDKHRAIEKAEALAKVEARGFDEYDYMDISFAKCPYCDFELDAHEIPNESETLKCGQCDNKFELEVHYNPTFTSRRIGKS